MRADDRAGEVDDDVLNAEALLNELLCVFGVLDAVTVADEHGLTGRIDGRLLHTVYQRTDGGFAAAGLADVGQLAVVVGVHDGLDLKRCAEKGRRGGDTAAALEVHEIVHGEPVAQMRAERLKVGGKLLHGSALALLLDGVVNEQALTEGGAEAVDGHDLPLGIFFAQLRGGNDAGLIGGAEARGEADVEDVTAFLQAGFHDLDERLGIHRAGAGLGAGAEFLIQLVETDLATVQVILVGFMIDCKAQRQDDQAVAVRQLLRKVTGRVGDDLIGHCHISSSFLVCRSKMMHLSYRLCPQKARDSLKVRLYGSKGEFY